MSCGVAWSRCGPRRVHIGRNWCKSATRAADSQGARSRLDADLQYLPNDSSELCYIWAWSERTASMHGIRSTAPPQSTLDGRYVMTQVIALALSIAVLGGIWAFLALGPLSGFVLVWT